MLLNGQMGVALEEYSVFKDYISLLKTLVYCTKLE